MPNVIIDGVEYIPAKNALANYKSIAKGLLYQFCGVCNDAELQEYINDEGMKVLVHDGGSGGESLKDVLNAIAKEA